MTGDVIVTTLNKRFFHVSHCQFGTEFNVASHILNFLALSFLFKLQRYSFNQNQNYASVNW